jgi:hypothetical protein
MKMEQTEHSETLAYKIQTPGNYPIENTYRTWRKFEIKDNRSAASKMSEDLEDFSLLGEDAEKI